MSEKLKNEADDLLNCISGLPLLIVSSIGLLPLLFGFDLKASVDAGSNLDVAFVGIAALLIVSISVTVGRLIKGKKLLPPKTLN